ncbi:hypothetical protein JW710_01555 [Candidatus Dojkabacteria bacterium]|nr:hypothetical protein [Candidatus Dojkabacteria bacterium]
MKISCLRRKLKFMLQNRGKMDETSANNLKKGFSVPTLSVGVFVAVVLAFCVVQLVIVSVLSPRGKELRRLNQEKEMLIEENRKIEHEIAKYSSMSIIKARSEKDLEMKRAEKVIYLEPTSTTADLSYNSGNE